MRIAIDIRPLLQSQYSGVSVYTKNLLSRLFAIDTENEYILYYNKNKRFAHELPSFNHPNVTVTHTRVPNRLFNLGLAFMDIPKLDRLVGGCDLFFFPNVNFSAVSARTKKVITVHDLSFVRHPEFFDFKHKLWHSLIRPKKQMQQADHLIAVSDATKKDLIELYGIQPHNITVSHLGLDPSMERVTDESRLRATRQKYSLPETFLLYLGTIEPRKNIEGIIESLEDVPDHAHLVIAGKRGWKHERVFSMAQKHSSRIHFIDYIDHEDKAALYTMAQALVWPSFYEGFGLPPLEAQACGTPVIVGAHSSLVEVVGSSGLLVNPDNLHEISAAINHLLTDQRLREQLVAAGYENVKRFSWEETARVTLNVFEQLGDTR